MAVRNLQEGESARRLGFRLGRGLRIRLRDGGEGQTKVTFRLSYQAPGGIFGYIADRVAVRQVGRTTADTLKRLKALVESRG